jgi:hypothetical protein
MLHDMKNHGDAKTMRKALLTFLIIAQISRSGPIPEN